MHREKNDTYIGDDASRKEYNEPKKQYSRVTRISGTVSVALMNRTTLQCVNAEWSAISSRAACRDQAEETAITLTA